MYLNCLFLRVYCKILKICLFNGFLVLLFWYRFDMDMSEESYYIYNVVYVVVYSFYEMF